MQAFKPQSPLIRPSSSPNTWQNMAKHGKTQQGKGSKGQHPNLQCGIAVGECVRTAEEDHRVQVWNRMEQNGSHGSLMSRLPEHAQPLGSSCHAKISLLIRSIGRFWHISIAPGQALIAAARSGNDLQSPCLQSKALAVSGRANAAEIKDQAHDNCHKAEAKPAPSICLKLLCKHYLRACRKSFCSRISARL